MSSHSKKEQTHHNKKIGVTSSKEIFYLLCSALSTGIDIAFFTICRNCDENALI